MDEELAIACGQILREDDLRLDEGVIECLQTKDCAVEIVFGGESSIRIYSYTQKMLSDIIPIMHSFNIRVIDEVSYEINKNGKLYHIMKLNTQMSDPLKFEANQTNIISLFLAVLNKEISIIRNKLFELSCLENFCVRGVLLFIAIVKFEGQLVSAFNESMLIKTLLKHSLITRLFLDYFINKFSPNAVRTIEAFEEEIKKALQKIADLNEDKILRLFFEILKNTKRTNFFLEKETISLKVHTNSIGYYLKGINPTIEGFVFHPDFVGVHLRMDKVSRGGLRWSNRMDDYRDEIRSLMIAQEAKNAVIIPKGAKGGFVIFKENPTQEEFEFCYLSFVDALFDLVDNKIDNNIIRDERIVAYDGDDFYFVVAADKGTSQMSDVANSISIKRNFWLKDAFASGGSHGYHHKSLGVTAKGALISSQRFFIEKGVDFYQNPITVVGVGSMNGDVFGNGLLQSEMFLLKAAISHREIFIDPNPDPKISYQERKRLYDDNNASWEKYDITKISQGGGVFRRDEKEITLSPQIKEAFDIHKSIVDSEELIRYILKAKVDMIYLGGIGTYYKSSIENNIDIGDKENENVRVSANEIRATVVCEGANLGMTMQSRIEYAKEGGKVNLDSIDNAAGVNTSDHEVNIKILLNGLIHKGFFDENSKNEQFKSLTEFVVNSVLSSNYYQALALSLDEKRSQKNIYEFNKSIDVLENNIGYFRRKDFYIPKSSEIDKVLSPEGGIVRPILSTLMLYSKILIQNILVKDEMIEEHIFSKYLFEYFPKSFVAIYENEIIQHPLKKEIIALIVANLIVNNCGTTFICDLDENGVDAFVLKIRAYLLSNLFFGGNEIRHALYRSDFDICAEDSYRFLLELEQKILLNAKTMLYKLEVSEMNFENIVMLREKTIHALSVFGFDFTFDFEHYDLNKFIKSLNYFRLIMHVFEIKKSTQLDIEHITGLYYKLILDLRIVELLEKLEALEESDQIHTTLKSQLFKIIESLIIELIKHLILFRRKDEAFDTTLASFLNERKKEYDYYCTLLDTMQSNPTVLEFVIIVNQLQLLR